MDENAPIFDKEGALERVDNDLELFGELLKIFFSEFDDSVGKIQGAVESSNGEELRNTAHAIKSALGNIGAMRGHSIAYALEKKGKDGEFEGALELVGALRETTAQYKELAEQVLA